MRTEKAADRAWRSGHECDYRAPNRALPTARRSSTSKFCIGSRCGSAGLVVSAGATHRSRTARSRGMSVAKSLLMVTIAALNPDARPRERLLSCGAAQLALRRGTVSLAGPHFGRAAALPVRAADHVSAAIAGAEVHRFVADIIGRRNRRAQHRTAAAWQSEMGVPATQATLAIATRTYGASMSAVSAGQTSSCS